MNKPVSYAEEFTRLGRCPCSCCSNVSRAELYGSEFVANEMERWLHTRPSERWALTEEGRERGQRAGWALPAWAEGGAT